MRRHLSTSGSAEIVAKRARFEPMITNNYITFSISIQKLSSPGKTHLTNYKLHHISTSGTAQIDTQLLAVYQKIIPTNMSHGIEDSYGQHI